MAVTTRAIAYMSLAAVIVASIVVALNISGTKVLVETAPPTLRTIAPSTLAGGVLAYKKQANLRSEVIARVAEILVAEGTSVREGDVVLRLDDQSFLAAQKQYAAEVRLRQIEIRRQETLIDELSSQVIRKSSLHERSLVSDEEVEASKNRLALGRISLESTSQELRQAEARLEQAKDTLRKTRITAPISGDVISLDIKPGETAIASATNIPGSSLMTIADPMTVYAEVYVDEADISRVEVGQSAEVILVSYPKLPLEGTVRFISRTAKKREGKQTLSFTVELDITNTHNLSLYPGLSCRVEIFSKDVGRKTLTVPIQSVLAQEDRSIALFKNYVFTNDRGIAKQVFVVTGASDDAFIEIAEGLAETQEVIIGPDQELRSLKEGDAIATRR